jgi:hypothetical protein
MARYFFDIADGGTLVRDEIGLECASLPQVHRAVIAVLPELVFEEFPDGELRYFAVCVRDQSDTYLFGATCLFGQRRDDHGREV